MFPAEPSKGKLAQFLLPFSSQSLRGTPGLGHFFSLLFSRFYISCWGISNEGVSIVTVAEAELGAQLRAKALKLHQDVVTHTKGLFLPSTSLCKALSTFTKWVVASHHKGHIPFVSPMRLVAIDWQS